MKKYIVYMLFVVTCLVVTGCSPTGSPIGAAKTSFNEYVQDFGIPFKDDTYKVLSNDGIFATVRINAYFKGSSNSDWVEKEADLDVRKIGSEWQASDILFLKFGMPHRFLQQTRTVIQGNQQATEQVHVDSTAQAALYIKEIWNGEEGNQIRELIQSSQIVLAEAVEKRDPSILQGTFVNDFDTATSSGDNLTKAADIIKCDKTLNKVGMGYIYYYPNSKFLFTDEYNIGPKFYSSTRMGIIATFNTKGKRFICSVTDTGKIYIESTDYEQSWSDAMCIYLRKVDRQWLIEFTEVGGAFSCDIYDGEWWKH